MNERTVQIIGVVTLRVVTALVIGEVIGSAISRPIAAWRMKKNVNANNIATMFMGMNKRICDLEEKVKE